MRKLLICGLAALTMLSACASFQSQDPKAILAEVQFGAALAEAAYDAICPVTGGPAFCADNAANYVKAKAVLQAAINTAAAAIVASNDVNTVNVAALLQQLEQDWATYNQLVNSVQAKNAALRHTSYRPIPLH